VPTERQQSINNLVYRIGNNPRAVLGLIPMIETLAAFIDNMITLEVATPKYERQQNINTGSTEH
jgi:hypothetical protein